MPNLLSGFRVATPRLLSGFGVEGLGFSASHGAFGAFGLLGFRFMGFASRGWPFRIQGFGLKQVFWFGVFLILRFRLCQPKIRGFGQANYLFEVGQTTAAQRLRRLSQVPSSGFAVLCHP